MSLAHEEPVWTLPDLLALPDDGRCSELLWGKIVVNPAPSARHADLVDGLAAELRAVCPGHLRVRTSSGIVIPGRPVVNAPAADIYVATRSSPSEPYVVADDVLLVVEVSLSTLSRDRGPKAAAYAAGRIPWYWIVEGDLTLRVLRLGSDGRYETAQVVRPGAAVRVLGPEGLAVVLDPGALEGP